MTETIRPTSRHALRQAAALNREPQPSTPESPSPAWATGRRHEGVSRPAREPQLAQLFPGSRPIPVVYSPRAGVDLLAASRLGRLATEDPAAPTTVAGQPPKGETDHAPRVAGPRIAAPSRPLPITQAPASAAISAVLAGATVRQNAVKQRSRPVSPPSRDDPLTGTLPGSVLAPRVEGGPSLARPNSAPISTGFSAGLSGDVSDFAAPPLPASRGPLPSAPDSAAIGRAKATPTAPPPYRPRTVNPIAAVPARAAAAVGLSEPDWAAFDFAEVPQPEAYPTAPPSQPVPVIPPQPNLTGRPVSTESDRDSFAHTQPPVYATGSIQTVAAPIRRMAPPNAVSPMTARPVPLRQADLDRVSPTPLEPNGQGSLGSSRPVDSLANDPAALDLFDPFSGEPTGFDPVGAAAEPTQVGQLAEFELIDLSDDTLASFDGGAINAPTEPGTKFERAQLDVRSSDGSTQVSQTGEEALVDLFEVAPPSLEPLPELLATVDSATAYDLSGPTFSPVVPPVSEPLMAELETPSTAPAPESVAPVEEEMWEPPPTLLEDGRGPWMVGPEAHREQPKGSSSRLIVRAVYVILAGIAIGAAIWAVTSYLSSWIS